MLINFRIINVAEVVMNFVSFRMYRSFQRPDAGRVMEMFASELQVQAEGQVVKNNGH